ncbi:MAG TPA: hypothetical protein VNN73_07230 [Blastocatellia bacterium]|nr:hypothetical protein [Blastocatellia bacterium]
MNIVTPTSLSREQGGLLEELAKLEAKDGHQQDGGIIDKVKNIFS